MKNKKLQLKPHKDESLRRFHPWIFSGAVARKDDDISEGEVIDVYDAAGQFIATGHYQTGTITVRVLSFTPTPIDDQFWHARIQSALDMRTAAGIAEAPQNNIFRLVHGEGDRLPGLIIDCYGRTAVMQAHSMGMHLSRQAIARAVVDVMKGRIENVYYKSETTLHLPQNQGNEDGFIYGGTPDSVAMENGLNFHIDWLRGQKTGFFIDQRENRKLLQHYAKGRRVLNMFCYTGAFSVYAMRGGALSVHSVDSSEKAISLTDKNIRLNFDADDMRHQSFCEDAFKFLDATQDTYDLIILDPPAFAKHRGALPNALKGYTRLNLKALESIKPGSILFTFSCSQAVNQQQFLNAVLTAAVKSKRHVRILHRLHQPADHPVSIYHPEGEYLKGLVLYVE